MSTACTIDDTDDPVVLLQYMRPEEDLRGYRYRVPWRGEYRLFRSANVVKMEDYRQPGEMGRILDRLQRGSYASPALISRYGQETVR
jgi:hypothetical protein